MKRTALVWIVLALATLPATAGSPGEETTETEQAHSTFGESITVTATPIEEAARLDELAGKVETVNREQVEELNAHDLATALRRVPGVNITRYNPVGSYGGADGGAVFIRGHGAGRPGAQIQTTVDGIPRYVGVWTHPLLDTLSVDLAGAIEVMKSPQPVVYGNMAFGVVNLVPERGHGPGGGRLRLLVGPDATLAAIAEGGADWGDGDVFAVLSHRESEGERPHAAGRVDAGSVNLGFGLGGGWDLRFFLSGTDSWAEDPGREGEPLPPEAPRFEDSDAFSILSVGYDHGDGGRLEMRAYLNSGTIHWSQWDGEAGESFVSATDWDNSGLRLSLREHPWEGGTLRVGVDHDLYGGSFVEHRPGGDGPVTDLHFRSTSLWALVRHDFGGTLHLTPSAGIRWTDTRHFGSQWGAQAGLELTVGGTTLYVNGARAFNLPGVWTAVLYDGWNRPGQWKDLDPEVLVHWELGAMGHLGPAVEWNLSWFHDRVTDALRFAPPPPFPPSFANVGDSTVTGLEGSLGYRPLETLALYAGAAWSDPDPDEIPDLPRWTFSAGLNWQALSWLTFNFDMESLASRWVLSERWPSHPEELEGFTLLNTRIVGTFPFHGLLSHLQVYVAGENLADEWYEFRPGYPMPGRTFMLGVNLGFR